MLLCSGFRDLVESLQRKHLNPKIPTCSQLESGNIEKRLNVKQTSESRLVTKVRIYRMLFNPCISLYFIF